MRAFKRPPRSGSCTWHTHREPQPWASGETAPRKAKCRQCGLGVETPLWETLPSSAARSLGSRVSNLGSHPGLATHWVGDLEEVS